MAKIKEYTKNGAKAYWFQAYVGINPKTGKPRRTTRRGFKTIKEAKLALARIEAGVDVPRKKNEIKKKYTTFHDVYDIWIEVHKHKVKRTSFSRIVSLFDIYILPKFGEVALTEIDYAMCQNVINGWAGIFKNTNILKSYVSLVLKFAIKKGLLKINPMDYVDVPRKLESLKRESDKYLSEKELITFLDWFETHETPQNFAMIRLLAYTGIRVGEMTALTWSDFIEYDRTISINKNAVKINKLTEISTTKTKKSNRILHLDNRTFEVLKEWKDFQKYFLTAQGMKVKNDDEQYIFPRNNNTINYLDYAGHIIRKYPYSKVHPHMLRHTHATLLIQAGLPISDVQHRLGHSNTTTTLNVYTHHSKDESKIIDVLENDFGIQNGIHR